MAQYKIDLVDRPTGKPGGSGGPTVTERRHFDSEVEAIQHGYEMHRARKGSTIGFRVFDAAGKCVYLWPPAQSRT